MLEPIQADVSLKYKCPKCGFDHWFDGEQVMCMTSLVCLSCKAKTPIRPIQSLQIKPVYKGITQSTIKTPVVKPSVQPVKQGNSLNRDDYISMLVEAGFTETEAKAKVQRAIQTGSINNEDAFLKEVFDV